MIKNKNKKDKKLKDCEMSEELTGFILDKWAGEMAQNIFVGNIGAFTTKDKETEGYYMVEWCSEPYTAQCNRELTDYRPSIIVQAGELIYDVY